MVEVSYVNNMMILCKLEFPTAKSWTLDIVICVILIKSRKKILEQYMYICRQHKNKAFIYIENKK